MRTDYFDDLLADVVTPVTPNPEQSVTGGKPEKPRNRADSSPLLHLLHPLHPETDNPEHDERIKQGDGGFPRPKPVRVFAYRLADDPAAELVFIAPGASLDDARRRLAYQFGADRVIEVRARRSTEGDHG